MINSLVWSVMPSNCCNAENRELQAFYLAVISSDSHRCLVQQLIATFCLLQHKVPLLSVLGPHVQCVSTRTVCPCRPLTSPAVRLTRMWIRWQHCWSKSCRVYWTSRWAVNMGCVHIALCRVHGLFPCIQLSEGPNPPSPPIVCLACGSVCIEGCCREEGWT